MDSLDSTKRSLKFAGTTEVSAEPSLNLSLLTGFLRSHIEGFEGPVSLRQFRGGQSNPTYLVDSPRGKFVLRRRPPGIGDATAHAVDREYRVIKALQNTGVPVPQAIAHCADTSVLGTEFFVMSFVEGAIFWDLQLPSLAPASRAAIYDRMNATLAAIHSVDPAAVGLADFGKPAHYLERQVKRWTRQYREAVRTPVPSMESLSEWLPRHLPPDEAALINGDFRLDNLIFNPDTLQIVAVLDWELSTLGHPLSDVASHCVAWRLAPGILAGISGEDLDSLGIPSESEYIKAYMKRTGRTQEINWEWFFAFALFKLAAILFGVAARGERGAGTNEFSSDFGVAALAVASEGWRSATNSGLR